LRVSGINGLIGHDEDYGIPPGRFTRIDKIKGIGILVTHQPPYIPELYPNMRDNEPAMLMTQALKRIRPRLHFSGHMTGGCYSYYEFKWGKYLRVDTSARFRCYALTDGRDVTVYQKGGGGFQVQPVEDRFTFANLSFLYFSQVLHDPLVYVVYDVTPPAGSIFVIDPRKDVPILWATVVTNFRVLTTYRFFSLQIL